MPAFQYAKINGWGQGEGWGVRKEGPGGQTGLRCRLGWSRVKAPGGRKQLSCKTQRLHLSQLISFLPSPAPLRLRVDEQSQSGSEWAAEAC